MISVLINAYACAPNRGSEPGMAWNWVINLAKYCKVYVITEGEWKDEIEIAINKLPQGKNLVFYYNPLSEKIRKMCWNQGDWRFYYYYQKWQKSTLEIATEILKSNQIDIIHQLNMIGFREPGFLWKIENKPFVWGPVDAKESFPIAYLEGASIKNKIKMYLKNEITKIQLKSGRRIRNAVNNAKFVVSASSESVLTFKKYFDCESVLINETGCYPIASSDLFIKKEKQIFNILWVGKFDFRKQLILALKTISKIKDLTIKFHIAGGSQNDNETYQLIASDLGIANKCIWHGIVSHQQIQKLMQESDLFFFTSVAEGTPHVVLESIANRLPVLCFDCCGQGDSVSEETGVKVALSNPVQSVLDFSDSIKKLYENRTILKQMSINCNQKINELSWDNKAKKMINLYKKSLNEFNKNKSFLEIFS
jgi:glycosyltransferase involved in cell wall biosynthesis